MSAMITFTPRSPADVRSAAAEPAAYTFRARTRWIDGAHSRSTIHGFAVAGAEDDSRARAFVLDAGEPASLGGEDDGPTPAEHLLHALAASLTASIIEVAASSAVELRSLASTAEGDMDPARERFARIRLDVAVEGDVPTAEIHALVARAKARSAVYALVAGGAPVEVHVSAFEAAV